MVYLDKFVLAIMRDGRPVRETSDKRVPLPFNTEYSIRLKNLYPDYDSICKLSVDGMKVGDFVVHAGRTVDIERFLNGDNRRGNRFKFVSINHGDVQDPSSDDNGIVEAEFFRAATANYVLTTTSWPCDVPSFQLYYGTSAIGSMGVNTSIDNGTKCFRSTSLSSAHNASFAVENCAADTQGATVQGSISRQQFTTVDDFPVVSTPVVLRLKLFGADESVKRFRYCVSCGAKAQPRFNFCPSCGVRL